MKLTDRKRQQILLAAVKEFRNNGFSGTSMDNVAQRAEVSKRTVYNHFSSKDALFMGIVEYMFGLMIETSPEPYQPERGIQEQLEEIAKAKVDLFSSEDFLDLSRVTVPEAIVNPEKLTHAMKQISVIETDMGKWFAAAIKDGKLNIESPSDACDEFMGLVKMEAFWPRLMKGKPAPTNNEKACMIKKAVGMFLAYYQS